MKEWEGRENEELKGRNGKGGKKEEVKRGGAKGRRRRKEGEHKFLIYCNRKILCYE